jgi:hypothetical protein
MVRRIHPDRLGCPQLLRPDRPVCPRPVRLDRRACRQLLRPGRRVCLQPMRPQRRGRPVCRQRVLRMRPVRQRGRDGVRVIVDSLWDRHVGAAEGEESTVARARDGYQEAASCALAMPRSRTRTTSSPGHPRGGRLADSARNGVSRRAGGVPKLLRRVVNLGTRGTNCTVARARDGYLAAPPPSVRRLSTEGIVRGPSVLRTAVGSG